MAEINPIRDILPLASQFKTPTPPPAPGNEALRELQIKHLLTGMEQRGQTERKAADIAGTLRREALLKNLPLDPEELRPDAPFSTSTKEDVTLRQRLRNALTGAEAAHRAKQGGIVPKRTIGPLGSPVDPSFKLGDFHKLLMTTGTTLGVDQALAGTKAATGTGEEVKEEELVIPGGPAVGLKRRTVTRKKEDKFEEKGTRRSADLSATELDMSAANRLMARAARAFPGTEIRGPFQIKDQIFITVDGIAVPINRKKK